MRGHIYAATGASLLTLAVMSSQTAVAADCPADHDKLEKALKASVKPSGGPTNGGLDNNEWAALVTPRRRHLRGCLQRRQARRPMARQPRDRGREGQHGERAEPQWICAFHRQPLRRRATGRLPVWTGLERPAQSGRSLFRRSNAVWLRFRPVRRQIPWRRDHVRRRACPLRRQERRRRPRRQRRQLLRRSQHRLARASGAGIGQGAGRRGSGPQR